MENFAGMAILAIFPVCMVFATFYDIFTMTIPNKISLALIAGFVILAPLAGMGWQDMAMHFGVAAIVLVVGYLFFLAGWMGAGDAKLLASSALWFGAASSVPYIMYASLLGGVLTLVIWLGRKARLPVEVFNKQWLTRLFDNKEGIPYGAALGPAALIVFAESPWMDFISAGTPVN